MFSQVKIIPQYKQTDRGDYFELAVAKQQHIDNTKICLDGESRENSKEIEQDHFLLFGGVKDKKSNPVTQDVFPQLSKSELDPLRSENDNFPKQKLFEHCFSYLDDEESQENEKLQALPRRVCERWSRAALVISVISICTTLGFGIASFAESRVTSSSSMFASAFDAILGSFNSIIVAWRFRDTLNGKVAPKREKAACFVIALSFIIGGVCTGTESSFRLTHRDHPNKPDVLLIILSASFICYLLLFYAQNCIALKLKSASMKAAAVDSALAALMSLGIFASTYVYRVHPELWYLDHSVALILGLISTIYGLKLLCDVTCGLKEISNL